jgi:hypothetical protein
MTRPRPPLRSSERTFSSTPIVGSDASDGELDSGLTCAHARARSADLLCGQTCQGVLLATGGRGFSSRSGARLLPHGSACADFFSAARVLKTLWGIKTIKRRGGQHGSTLKTRGFSTPSRKASAIFPQKSGIIFPPPSVPATLDAP